MALVVEAERPSNFDLTRLQKAVEVYLSGFSVSVHEGALPIGTPVDRIATLTWRVSDDDSRLEVVIQDGESTTSTLLRRGEKSRSDFDYREIALKLRAALVIAERQRSAATNEDV